MTASLELIRDAIHDVGIDDANWYLATGADGVPYFRSEYRRINRRRTDRLRTRQIGR